MREDIEKSSMSDLRDFLENIRKFSPRIGEMAMRHVSYLSVQSFHIRSRNYYYYCEKHILNKYKLLI